MADLYNTVQKQGKQLDGLQKKVDTQDTRIETLETKAMATPPQMPVNIPAPKVTVTVPDNIATKENIVGVVNKALHLMTDYVAEVVTKLYTENPPQKSANPTPEISDELIEKIAQKAADKAADKAVSKRYEKLDAMADTVMHRIYNLVHGAIWAAIPKWAYLIFAIAILAAGGFGYGFFYQLNENTKLKDVEWLYRYERGLHTNPNVVIHRERLMLHGKPHEVDSLKSLIRHHEQRTKADTTFVYYYPSNP